MRSIQAFSPRRASGRIAILVAACFCAAANADIATQWNTVGLDTIRATGTSPPATGRAMAMVHTAMFDAYNGIAGGFSQYAAGICPTGGADAQAAAAQAARDVLVGLYPGRTGVYDATLASQLAAIPDGAAKAAGISYGQSVAAQTLARRATDGSSNTPAYTPSGQIGGWVQTPGGTANPLFQQYATVSCWAMQSSSMFRPAAPPSVGSAEYAAAYDEVRRLGSAGSVERTSEQTDIARMWAAGGGTITPPGMWNRIAQDIGTARGNTEAQNIRMLAMLNIALADAAVCAWDAKVLFDYWRPVTGIRQGDADGNDLTTGDINWTPLLVTPSFQAYTSGHSTFSAAAAALLAGFFGTDSINFNVTADNLPITRSFSSLSGAAAEAGQSRIYGGIHWQFDNTAGLQSGAALGSYVAGGVLQVPAPGVAGVLVLGTLVAGRRRRAGV